MSELFLWSQWRSRCLSYLVDNRTVRLLSGANLIFSTPKVHWLQVLDPLKVLSDANNDHLLEIMVIIAKTDKSLYILILNVDNIPSLTILANGCH